MTPACRGGRALRSTLLAWVLLACSAPASAVALVATTTTLTPAEAARSDAVLAEVAAQLPDRWREALASVPVDWRGDLPDTVGGRAIGGRVLLRRTLLDAANDRPARAALIHELAHLFDRSPAGGMSRDPRLLELAGWQDAPLRPWRTANAFSDRSPDAYELTSPAEFVAVNLEHFLLDADYACRRPALSRYFAQASGAAPTQAVCPADLPFMQASPEAAAPLLAIDPSRIYAVDYLLADANDRPMSRWGHSMLRLVVCAPGRAPGPDCRLDVTYHQVLSFRAFVDDVQISSWRGLTGSYPSRLFLLPLPQVVDEYTQVELRGLRSIPLQLRPGEIATLLQRAALVHWSYDGRYAFIGNNCAVETARLLHAGIPRLSTARLMSITPTGLLHRLERAGLVQPGATGDYFEPANAHYQQLYDVARASLELPQTRVEDWLELPPATRANVFTDADLRSSAALLLLEQAALRRQDLAARDALKHRLLASRRAAARDVLALENQLTRPALLLPGSGYGLPQAGERMALAERGDALAARWQQQRTTLLAQAREWLPSPLRESLDATAANIDTLGARLRQLNAAQGGLQLH